MFEKAGKGRIQARDLGELLRCLGWNPSEQDLEEARHELEVSGVSGAEMAFFFLFFLFFISPLSGVCRVYSVTAFCEFPDVLVSLMAL